MKRSWWRFFFSFFYIFAAVAWIPLKFGTDIQDIQRMNPNAFGHPLTFHLVAGQHFQIFSEIFQYILAELSKNKRFFGSNWSVSTIFDRLPWTLVQTFMFMINCKTEVIPNSLTELQLDNLFLSSSSSWWSKIGQPFCIVDLFRFFSSQSILVLL